MEYYCTACDELHEVEDGIEPVTALDIFEKHSNAPKWIEDFQVPNDELEAICENCHDAAVTVIKARNEPIRLGRNYVSVF